MLYIDPRFSNHKLKALIFIIIGIFCTIYAITEFFIMIISKTVTNAKIDYIYKFKFNDILSHGKPKIQYMAHISFKTSKEKIVNCEIPISKRFFNSFSENYNNAPFLEKVYVLKDVKSTQIDFISWLVTQSKYYTSPTINIIYSKLFPDPKFITILDFRFKKIN